MFLYLEDSSNEEAAWKSALESELECQTNTAVDLNAVLVVKKSRIQELEVFVFVQIICFSFVN